MLPDSFQALWHDATFARLLQALPTALTGSLFMLFALLEVALACIKWMLFLVIIVATFLLGLGLFVVVVGVLMVLLMGVVMEDVEAKEREEDAEEPHTDGEEEQGNKLPVVRCTWDDISRKEQREDGEEDDARIDPQIEEMTVEVEDKKRLKELWAKIIAEIKEYNRLAAGHRQKRVLQTLNRGHATPSTSL